MAITFIQEWLYRGGTEKTSLPTDTIGPYMPAGYSAKEFRINVFKFYTDKSIQAPKIRLRCISNGTSDTQYLGAYFVSCSENSSPDMTICGKNEDTLAGKYQTRIRFGYDWNSTTQSWGSSNGTSWGSGTCTSDIKIPKGYFFVYVGSGTGASGTWTTIYPWCTTATPTSRYQGQVTGTEITQYTIQYNGNGGYANPATQKKDWGIPVTISSIIPIRNNYTFLGWSPTQTATTPTYVGGNSYTNNADVILYAVWKINTYTVTYDNNGYATLSIPQNQVKTHDESLTLSSELPILKVTEHTVPYVSITLDFNDGSTLPQVLTSTNTTTYEFYSWNTASDGSGTNYSPGSTYSENESIILYLIRKSTIVRNPIFLPTLTRTGYEFLGWSKQPPKVRRVSKQHWSDVDCRLESAIYPEFWEYIDAEGGIVNVSSVADDVFVAYDNYRPIPGSDIPGPILMKTDREEYESGNPDYWSADGEPFYYVDTLFIDDMWMDKWVKYQEDDPSLAEISTACVYVYTPCITVPHYKETELLTDIYDTMHGHTTLYAIWKPLGTVNIFNQNSNKFDKYRVVIYNSSTQQWEVYLPKIYGSGVWNDYV